MKGLREELARVGIRGRLARRIELELADHLRCDPGAQLGSPALIAERFAAELRLPRTRRATYTGFGALALTAVLLAVPLRGLPAARGHATAVSLGGLTIALAGQVALVAGLLALWRMLFTTTELRLVQRRLTVALAAGAVVLAGELTQAVALRPLAAVVVAVPAVALLGAAHRLRAAVALTPDMETTRAFPLPLAAATGLGATLLMGIGSTIAERSWNEGLWRGMIEGVTFAACFLALGRRLGIRR